MHRNYKIGLIRKLTLKAALRRKDDFQEFAGAKLRKFASDALAIHTLMSRCRPQVIVEMGACHGGSALQMASYADLIGVENIISCDIAEVPRPAHPKIQYLLGDNAGTEIVKQVHDLVGGRRCSLILDSNHHAYHVTKELDLYHDLVTPGQALIVEDTHVDVLNFRAFRETGGPLVALDAFLNKHPEFQTAEGAEPYLTTNLFGYLIRR